MIDVRAVLRTLGVLLLFLGMALLLPMGVALFYGEAAWWSFGVTALGSMLFGGGAWFGLKPEEAYNLRAREGFLIVAVAWAVLSLAGALPFVLSGTLDSYTDAFFETMSGFATTGATILGGADTPAIEDLPNALLFWRSMAHWLGGMGIIVLTLAILPFLGVGGMQLFKAEVPGPSADKLTPRVRETAKRLWLIYFAFTVLQILLLLPAMSLFDAVNHAFSTMATGGFSTENASVGQYDSAYIDWIVTLFMFLGGINFALHYRLLTGRTITVLRDTELWVFTGLCVVATLLVFAALWTPVSTALGIAPGAYLSYDNGLEALRHAAFQVVAIITTTGFATADYMQWAPLGLTVIFMLFFVGGMAGSTSGGVKVVRIVLLAKNSFKEVKQLVHPQAILPIRLGTTVVPQDVMRNVLSFIVLFFGLIGFGTLFLAALGVDLFESLGMAMSAVGNVGPAFGQFGPAGSYAAVPEAGKWMLSFLMMAGRLEIFTVLILFAPTFWRR
ncbi:MAG: potassium transporter TrkG [Bacteroidota bacterium]